MADIRESVGLRIARLRRDAGLTQAALADSIRMSRAYLSRLEGGEVNATLESLHRIALGIGVSLTVLVDVTSDPGRRSAPDRFGRVAASLAHRATEAELRRFERLMRAYFRDTSSTKGDKSRRSRSK